MEIAFCIFASIGWVMTLRDINRSEFTDDSGSKWFWLVALLGYIGIMFYYYYGIKRKTKKKYKFIK